MSKVEEYKKMAMEHINDLKVWSNTFLNNARQNKLSTDDVAMLDVVFHGVSGVVAWLLPVVIVVFLGGNDSYFPRDYLRFAATLHLTIALITYLSIKWPTEVRRELSKALFVGNALWCATALINCIYGSISYLVFPLVLVNGALCYFRGKVAGMI
eukprot:GEZU01039262.1.p1 GENE.GEZU01039262.1~~GEZU01039262.1.p1  ORF type:complete len:155 (-),score=55.11 GEZU01039262.1:219-683(-)